MSLHKKAPLRQLSGQEPQELTRDLSLAGHPGRRGHSGQDTSGRRPQCRPLRRCPLGRPRLQQRGLAPHRPVQRRGRRRSDYMTPCAPTEI